jgi:glycosyltransferase involved in cell wall biosynthesis
MYNIIFYCPDINFKFDGSTPDTKGIGGGKTALVRVAKALRDLDNNVTVYCNCDNGVHNGVIYRQLDELKDDKCHVFIVTTSSKCELDESFNKIVANIKIIWIHGKSPIKGIYKFQYDYIYCVSNYLKNVAISEWSLSSKKIFVTHNGFCEENIINALRCKVPRDIYGVVFASHPIKGLSRTIDIIKSMRQIEPRLYLDVYGGYRLWGSDANELDLSKDDFVHYKGLIDQKELINNFMRYNFMIAVSSVPDTSSITIHEAKKCGVVIITSSIGGNTEIIKDGYDGFLINEDYMSDECKNKVVSVINKLLDDQNYLQYIRKNAMKYNRSWNIVAEEWMNHWKYIMKKKSWIERIVLRSKRKLSIV